LQKIGEDIPIPADDGGMTGNFTWDDLKTWAKKVTAKGPFSYMPPGSYSIGDVHFWRQYGFEMVGKDGATLDLPKDPATAWLQYRYDSDKVDKTSPPLKSDSTTLFIQGQVMSAVVWPVFLGSMADLVKGNFEFDFRLVPVLKKGDKRRSVLNQHIYGVCDNRFSKYPDAAFSYLTWITGKEFSVQGVIAGMGACVARPDFWADQRVYDKRPGYKYIKDIMANVEPDINIANWQADKFNTGTYIPIMQKMDQGQATVAETYDALSKQIPPVLTMSPA
jgi:ABC-type glycerol-3-phosphate transport system substrate-binding protein